MVTAKQRIGELLPAINLRTLGGFVDGSLAVSTVEADGYVDVSASVLDNVDVVGDGVGLYTFTFNKLFPRVLAVVASPVLASAAAIKVDVVSWSQTGFVLRFADSSSGAATQPADTAGLTYHVFIQNSMVNPGGTYGDG